MKLAVNANFWNPFDKHDTGALCTLVITDHLYSTQMAEVDVGLLGHP